ncbi:MAG: NAD(P)-dependent oxidoreductase [Chromatiaceae bacterium]|nr:NAD(P)-dependent oxidoreductase [Chromatiaceae bacterium]
MTHRSALVTGATGFVGRHLVRHLLREGWMVQAIVRPDSDRAPLAGLSDRLRLHNHNGTTNSLIELFQTTQPSVVFHLASLFISEHQPKDVEPLIHSNLLFATQLVEAMTLAGVTALVNTGTAWQHYENDDYSPVNLYAATKQAFEALLQYYIEARGLRVITLKLHDTYGPDDPRPKLINLLRRTAAGEEPLAMSGGDQMMDLVHVVDVARAFLVSAERLQTVGSKSHEKYAVYSGEALVLRELVDKIQEISGLLLPIEWGGRPYRQREVMQLWQGPSLPGWEPQICLREGIAQTFSEIRQGN